MRDTIATILTSFIGGYLFACLRIAINYDAADLED